MRVVLSHHTFIHISIHFFTHLFIYLFTFSHIYSYIYSLFHFIKSQDNNEQVRWALVGDGSNRYVTYEYTLIYLLKLYSLSYFSNEFHLFTRDICLRMVLIQYILHYYN